MADVMEERVHSIHLGAGVTFVAGALLISISLALFPSLPAAKDSGADTRTATTVARSTVVIPTVAAVSWVRFWKPS